jgi:hypothetical protein
MRRAISRRTGVSENANRMGMGKGVKGQAHSSNGQVGGHHEKHAKVCTTSLETLRVCYITCTSFTQPSTCDVKIRTLKVLPGTDKKPPNFMTLLNHSAPGIENQQSSIFDSLNSVVTRGDKLLTVELKKIFT